MPVLDISCKWDHIFVLLWLASFTYFQVSFTSQHVSVLHFYGQIKILLLLLLPPRHCGLLWQLRWWRIHLQCRRRGFRLWFGTVPWRRAQQPSPVFLPRDPLDRGAWRAEVRGVTGRHSRAQHGKPHFVYPVMCWWARGWFPPLAIVDNAAVNISLPVSVWVLLVIDVRETAGLHS